MQRNKQPKVKRTGTTSNQLCCFDLILEYISIDVHVLLSPVGPTGITSLEKLKEGADYNPDQLWEVFFLFPVFTWQFRMADGLVLSL